MDLTDKDALREALESTVAWRSSGWNGTKEDVLRTLAALPAVRCEKCEHAMTWTTQAGEEFPFGNCYAAVGQANGDDGELSPNPPTFGCSYFERRQGGSDQ